jgi:hypothetical protein
MLAAVFAGLVGLAAFVIHSNRELPLPFHRLRPSELPTRPDRP